MQDNFSAYVPGCMDPWTSFFVSDITGSPRGAWLRYGHGASTVTWGDGGDGIRMSPWGDGELTRFGNNLAPKMEGLGKVSVFFGWMLNFRVCEFFAACIESRVLLLSNFLLLLEIGSFVCM